MNYVALFSVLSLLMTGCSFERTMKLDARLSVPPAVRQSPLHIGVYYSREYIEFTKKLEMTACGPNGRRDGTGVFFIFPLGVASRDLFDQITAGMFTAVTRMPDPSSTVSQSLSLDGYLAPEIESFEWDMACSKAYFSAGNLVANITYVIKLYSHNGQFVTSMSIHGSGAVQPKPCFRNCRDSLVTEQAMQDAMAKFMIEFYEQQEVKPWFLTLDKGRGAIK